MAHNSPEGFCAFLSFAMMRLAGGDAVTYMYENAGAAVSQEWSPVFTLL